MIALSPLAGFDGVCGAIAAGMDPDSDCADEGEGSCGLDGACSGMESCRRYSCP